ncbi:MAG: hypothetical protein KAS07_02100 [Candidatus Pacebacteria bacterium]|nr:hypothetical protein [Candidatus Paceibacterota bacterium]
MANEENKKEEIEKEIKETKEIEKSVSEEKTVEETPEDMEEKKEEEKTGKASFQEASNNKLPFIAIVVAVALIAAALFFKGFSPVPEVSYVNQVHGYSYEYPQGIQLVAKGNIPAELASQGVESMEQLNLTNGDSLLVYKNEESGDNIVYTILELSTRPTYTDFDSYATTLFESLDESKEIAGTEYIINDSEVGDGIASIEYSFEMEVPIDDAGNTRTGVFYDNIFQTEDGKAYSISFGYPKDVENATEYLTIYRNILISFEIGGEITEALVETPDEVDDLEDNLENDTTEVAEEEVVE